MSQYRKNDGTRLSAVLRQIAAAPDEDGIYTTDLLTAEHLAAYSWQRDPRQRALTHIGAALRALESDGLIKRTRTGRGGWQRGPTQKWAVTERGLHQIGWWATNPGRPPNARIAAQDAARERRRRAAAMIEEYARQGAGPGRLRWERRILATQLRAGGCSFRQIGVLFGVSAEMIRLDLLTPAAGPAIPPPRGAATAGAAPPVRITGPAGRRLRMFRPGEGMFAQLDVVTFTEW